MTSSAPDDLHDVLGEIRAKLAEGEHLAAYDASQGPAAAAIPPGPARLELRYLRALALARSGSTSRAEEQLQELGADVAGVPLSAQLAEDIAALGARLAKDRALAARGPVRSRLLADAAARYDEVHRRLGRPYAGINAATLWYLAGFPDRAEPLARRAAHLSSGADADPSTAYWACATRAEAALVLGDVDAARRALQEAAASGLDDHAARASTRRQLRLLCEHRGLDAEAVLAPIANPGVVHYCGHRIDPPGRSARFPSSAEDHVRGELDRWLRGRRVGFAYGSLAGGADILAAEALLDHGAALHVILPFDADEFLRASVLDCGPGWGERFDRCLGAARSVTVACDSAPLGDAVLFGYASRLAMGHALDHADRLEAAAWQVAVWDGRPGPSAAGTAHDVQTWSAAGRSTDRITPPAGVDRPAGMSDGGPEVRRVRAILFGDVTGFSRLRDEHLAPFQELVMGTVATALDGFGDGIVQRNTWGDGLFVIAADVCTGARVALAIQAALARLDLAGAGLHPDLGMRIGGHVGPLLPLWDPVLRAPTLMGRELTRAARIEPRTPPGEVYVTRAFAALLALEPRAPAVAEYVGHLTTAKGFETVPMYVLRASPEA